MSNSNVEMSDLLQLCVDEGASDLHIRVNVPPMLRIHGDLQQLDLDPLTPDDTERLVKSITSPEHQQMLQEQGGTDFGFAFGTQARFRVSVFKAKGNYGTVLRQIPNDLMQKAYDLYSFNVIPVMGQIIAGDRASYQYLVESIRKFPDQESFAAMIRAAGFGQVKYRNLTMGIAALHSGWKL